ncbi:hypothetical protein BS78_09G145300 [Paspalum vaginatum]|nr:hypothetical protein BS78_09G145300 [Paspalum vaginatum]
MPAPSPAPWPVSQDVAALADRASALSRAGPRDDLGTLAAALLRIQPVAHELERRCCLAPGDPEGPALRAWLLDLRDAVADAEDLLDELHRRREAGPPLSACVDAAFRGPGRKLRRLAERLDRVGDDSERLRPARAAAAAGGGVRSPSRVTGSVLAEREVFGREQERDSVVASLVGGREETRRSVAPVVAVVGHGGMGKTTLVQCVYNDARVEARFDVRAWVCVWDRSDEAELTREILQSIGCADDTLCDDGCSGLDSLQEKLEKSAASKRFLLVLDDVWIDEGKTEEENRSVWNKVLAPLRSAAVGSKILVTTRMKLVAEVLNAGHVVSLDRLRNDDCWLLLKEVALGGEAMDFPPEVREIVRAIVAKHISNGLEVRSL